MEVQWKCLRKVICTIGQLWCWRGPRCYGSGSFLKDAAALMERKEAIFIPLSIHVPSAVADNI